MTKLWAAGGGVLYSWQDTLANLVPVLLGPPDGAEIKINPISGHAADVAFSWLRPSKSIASELTISLNPSGRGDTVGEVGPLFTPGPPPSVVVGPGGVAAKDIAAPVMAYAKPGQTTYSTKVEYVPGTTYYWKVKAKGPVSSLDSEVRSFTIEAGGAVVPAIGSPANGGTVYDVPAFSWSPVTATTKYRFELSDDTVFAVPLYSADVTSTGIKPDIPLELGTYFWRVKALEPVPGEWSTIANFTVAEPVEAAPPPEVVIPPQPPPTVNVPDIVVPPPEVVVQPPVTEPTTSEGLLWAVIIIGAVLVIALIVLIVRTRRSV
jgi:hypothetical protein